MPILYVQGDATAPIMNEVGARHIIAHICNDAGGWGAGFTGALSRKWTKPRQMYSQMFKQGQATLGSIQMVQVDQKLFVCNMVAQHNYKGRNNPVPLNYPALELCLDQLSRYAQDFNNATIHMPRIGCGLAGGKWEEIEPGLNRFLDGLNVYVYDLSKEKAK